MRVHAESVAKRQRLLALRLCQDNGGRIADDALRAACRADGIYNSKRFMKNMRYDRTIFRMEVSRDGKVSWHLTSVAREAAREFAERIPAVASDLTAGLVSLNDLAPDIVALPPKPLLTAKYEPSADDATIAALVDQLIERARRAERTRIDARRPGNARPQTQMRWKDAEKACAETAVAIRAILICLRDERNRK